MSMLADHGSCNGHESNESTLILVTLTLVNNVNSQHQYLRWWAPTCHLLLPRHFWLKSFNCSMNAPGSFNSMSSKYSRRPIFTPITSTGRTFRCLQQQSVPVAVVLLAQVQGAFGNVHRLLGAVSHCTWLGQAHCTSSWRRRRRRLLGHLWSILTDHGCHRAAGPVQKKRVVWVWDWDVWSLKSEVVCLTVVCCWTDCIVWHCLHSRLACTCLPCQPACSLSLWGQNWQNIFCDYYCNGSRFHHRSMMKSEWQVQKLAYDCCSWAR